MKELKHKKIIILIMVLGTIMVVGGFSYALYYFSKSYDYNGITAAKISFDFEGNDIFPSESFVLESPDTARNRIDNYIDLTVTANNDSNRYIEYRINLLEDLKIPESFLQKFRFQDFRFDVYDIETEAVLIEEIQLNTLDDPIFIGYVPPKESSYSKSLRIRLWITEDAPLDDTRYYSTDSLNDTASNIKLEVNSNNMGLDANVFYVDLEKVTSNGDGYTYTNLYFYGNNIQSIRYVAHNGGRVNPTGAISNPTSAVRSPGGETYYKAFYDTVTRVETGHTEMMTRTKDTNAVVCFIATFEDGTETPFSPYNCVALFEESRNWVNPPAPRVEPLITNTLLETTTPLDDSSVNFGIKGSTGSDKGLLLMKSTENDDYPIYYYRGNVDNNNLIFGGYCWKIVRTTETGGTKIIYSGVPSNGRCNNTGTATHIKTAKFNSSSNSPAYAGYKYGSTHPSYSAKSASNLSSIGNIVYGKNITYANDNYTLTDTITKNGANYSTDKSDTSTSGMQYHHYTCLSSSSTCSTVYYIYYLASSSMYYFSLTGGRTNLDLLNEMLSNNDGSVNSTIYSELNAWYTANLLSYASQLEDTVFCNDRSIANYGGWDINIPNTSYLYFGAYGRLYTNKAPSLICTNPGDRYTVNSSNGNGKLDYPVGLLTADEYALAGAVYGTSNNSFYLYNGQTQRSLSPYAFGTGVDGFFLYSTGDLYNSNVSIAQGLRPVVSLDPSATITGGNGSSSTPYIVGN